jgi:hypothetical protein
MVDHVIEKRVERPPYITWVSKSQILWGEGFHFKNTINQDVKCGLCKHTRFKRPSNDFIISLHQKFGDTIHWPPPILMNMIQSVIRKNFINETVLGGKSDLDISFGKGYITEDGEYKPEYSKAICGYFIMKADHEYRQEQQVFMDNATMWMKLQFYLTKSTYQQAVMSQLEGARAKILINEMLLEKKSHDEISVDINPELITWEGEESEAA